MLSDLTVSSTFANWYSSSSLEGLSSNGSVRMPRDGCRTSRFGLPNFGCVYPMGGLKQ